jgi:hypothetical protein
VRTAAVLLFLALPVHGALLDGFENVSGWKAAPSEGVSLKLSQDEGVKGRALRLDFDFHGGAGYAVAHKDLPFALPANYEISFRLRGEVPVNNLEFKLIDSTGDNVWWVNRRSFAFPREWTEIRIRKRQIEFAWGPAGGGEIRDVAALELAVTAGTGGQGHILLDELTVRELPPEHPYNRTPQVTSSAHGIALDFLEEREYGGLVIDWGPGPHASTYEVQISDDGADWKTVRTVEGSNGGKDYLVLPETESRHLRLRFLEGSGVPRIDVKPLEFAANETFFAVIASDAPRGAYPRYLLGQGTYWTVVGADGDIGDTEEALVGEDGALEPGKRLWSIEPFLWMDGKLVSWGDVEAVPSLEKGFLPIPTVAWRHPPVSLTVTAFAAGDAGKSVLFARYHLRNDGPERKRARLFLAIRPFQVNPTWQFLNAPGGATEVRDIAWDGRVVQVDGRTVVPLQPPAGFGAATFDQGEAVEHLLAGKLPPAPGVSDPIAHASAALAWDFDLAPGEVGETDLAIPFHPDAPIQPIETAFAETVRSWEEKLGRVEIHGPSDLVDTMKSTLAWILIHRDGPAIQPGSRSYERSWIRDGALTSAALLRLGHEPEVRQFLSWYAPYQFADGKVPCCVDSRGADPVTENDSHGEFLYLIAEHWRYARDRAFLEQMWPHVEKTVAWIDKLRNQRRTDEYRKPDKLRYFGLLPESISHEGYSSKPVHSYWDDFWALRGLKDAVELAGALGKKDEQARWTKIRDEFRSDLLASLRRTIADHGIDFIPGSAELGDFDATSTTIALEPAGELKSLPQKELLRTFERYWQEFVARRDGPPGKKPDWEAYTPYEWRTVGTFVRLGWRDRAQELLDFFMADRRPRAWNQWPEVVWRDPRAPKFLGDLPHGWVGSDFLRSFLDLFAIEEENRLVLGAGVPDSWLAGDGIEIRGLRTKWGTLDLEMRQQGEAVRVRIGGGLRVPPGGVVVGETVIRELPADIRIERNRR